MNRFQRNRGYKHGDYWMISDRSGKKFRASEMRREWTGAMVHQSEFESRHPQDFVKVPPDLQNVPVARPRPADTFMGAKITYIAASHAAGETTLTVDSSADFSALDSILVMLDEGDSFLTSVASIPGATSIEISNPLPGATSADQAVVNRSSVTPSDLE